MLKPTIEAALVALALAGYAHANELDSYYWVAGRQVRVAVARDLVALRFSVEPQVGLINSIGDANDLKLADSELYAPLRSNRVVVFTVRPVVEVSNRYLFELQERLRRSGAPVADVGRVVKAETGALAVMTDRLTVAFEDGVSGLNAFTGLDVSSSVTAIRTLNERPLVVAFRVNADATRNALEIANAIYEYRDGIGRRLATYATPALRFPRELRTVPNQPQHPDDQLYSQQWHLNSAALADVDAPEAWDYTRGSKSVPTAGSCRVANRVRIAVFDVGVETTHPDLADNIAPGGKDYTTVPPGDDPNPDPNESHGTRAAGVIAACSNNGKLGVSGICPLCEILPIKINTFLTEYLVDALYDAKNLLGAEVISNSWGDKIGGIVGDDVRGALNVISGTSPPSNGIPVFFAVQNQNEDWCASDVSGLESVIAVSASSNVDQAGQSGGFGGCVDLVAPTQRDQAAFGLIITTDLGGTYTTTSNGFGGTSSSTALAAGIAGLVLSLNHDLTEKDVRSILEHAAEKIDLLPVGEMYTSGFSPRAGYGRVNAHRAVVPLVKIAASKDVVQVNEPFDIVVSASAPYLLAAVGWTRTSMACAAALEDWRDVEDRAYHEETWTGLTIEGPGTYVFRPNAKDKLHPMSDGYPHIASDAFPVLPEVTVNVQGIGPAREGCPRPNPPTLRSSTRHNTHMRDQRQSR